MNRNPADRFLDEILWKPQVSWDQTVEKDLIFLKPGPVIGADDPEARHVSVPGVEVAL